MAVDSLDYELLRWVPRCQRSFLDHEEKATIINWRPTATISPPTTGCTKRVAGNWCHRSKVCRPVSKRIVAGNLVNLIKDVRKDLNAPKLPVVIGELTGPWVDAPGAWATLRKAQANAASRPEFKGTVIFVETHAFVRLPKDSPNPGHGHHEFGNAETYFLVGDALGKGMIKLLAPAAK